MFSSLLGAGAGPISDTDATRGTVIALSTFVFLQLLNLQNARFPDHSALRRYALTNWRLWTALGVVLVVHVAAMSWDSAQVLFTGRATAVHLSLGDWALALAAATPILLFDELRKARAAPRRSA